MTRGQIIRQKRRERFMTQKEAADEMGVSSAILSLWERDAVEDIRFDSMERIARVLDIDPKRLCYI